MRGSCREPLNLRTNLYKPILLDKLILKEVYSGCGATRLEASAAALYQILLIKTYKPIHGDRST